MANELKATLFGQTSGCWDLARGREVVPTLEGTVTNNMFFSSRHSSRNSYLTANAYICDAALEYGKGNLCRYSLVRIGQGHYAIEQEYGVPGATQMLIAEMASNGLFRAVIKKAAGYEAMPNVVDAFKNKGIPHDGLYALVMMLASEKPRSDIKEHLDNLRTVMPGLVDSNGTIIANDAKDKTQLYLYKISDCTTIAVNSEDVKANVPNGLIPQLEESVIKSGALSGELLAGREPTLIRGVLAATPGVSARMEGKTVAEALVEFADFRKELDIPEEDRVYIPEFPDDYIVPPEVLKIARRYVKTRNAKNPMVNFLWRAITAYGKSTGAALLAYILGLPLYRVTCSPTMETQAFLADFVPDNSDITAPSNTGVQVPDYDELECDPASVYERYTGIAKEDATPQDCLEAFKAAVEANAKASSGPRYKLVESGFVRALRLGYIVEVQEMSRIKDAGVLVGLNEYNRPNAVIPLVDGTKVRRHPRAICVYTDNVGYASCRAVDPSVIRRMSFIIDSYDMPKERVIARVKYNTGFDNDELLNKMYEVWLAIADYCQTNDITEGSVSVAELESWAQAVMIDDMGEVVNNCIECVVAKATSDIREQMEIKSDVIEPSKIVGL